MSAPTKFGYQIVLYLGSTTATYYSSMIPIPVMTSEGTATGFFRIMSWNAGDPLPVDVIFSAAFVATPGEWSDPMPPS